MQNMTFLPSLLQKRLSKSITIVHVDYLFHFLQSTIAAATRVYNNQTFLAALTALKDLRSADLFEQQVHNQETKATHLASLRLCSSVALHVNFESPMSKFQKLSIKHEH